MARVKWWPFNRSERRSAITYDDVWGSTRDTKLINGDSIDVALTLAPVYAATRLLADSVSSLPLQTFRRSGNTRTQIPNMGLFDDPTEYGTTVDWVHRAMTSLALRGNAYGLITSWTADAWPRTIEWLHPDQVGLKDNRTVVRPEWYWMGRPVDPGTFVHIPGYTLPGQILGLSPIAAYAMTVETGILAAQFGRDWFRNGSTPSAVLETAEKVSQEQATTIKSRFRAAVSGREPVVLGAGVSYRPISVPANESQFLATMKMSAGQVATIYGIPPERIGGESGSSRTYANREQDSQDFVTFALRPYLTRLEAAFSRLVPRPQYVRFNVDAMVRADLMTRYQAHQLALSGGWMSKDEVRALEDLPPLPNGEGAGYAPALGANPAPPVDGARNDIRHPQLRVAE